MLFKKKKKYVYFKFVFLNLRNYELKDWMEDIGCLLVCVLNNYLNQKVGLLWLNIF